MTAKLNILKADISMHYFFNLTIKYIIFFQMILIIFIDFQ